MTDQENSESLPMGESKSPPVGVIGHEHRLHRGILGLTDIAASTMANVGPAMSFYFGFAFLAYTAGIASPLTIVAAGIAIAFLGNTLSEFTKAMPSTGSFISFIGKTFGPTSAVTTSIVAGIGYMLACASVVAISGGFLSIILQYYFKWNVPWGVLSIVLTAWATYMMVRGVKISTRVAGWFFVIEMVVLVAVSVASLIKNGNHLSFQPFNPGKITNGFSGLAAGFPLAIYLFIGWENSATLAEETDNPRKNVPKAVYLSAAIMMVSYVLFSYATVSDFGYNVNKLVAAPVPFITVAHNLFGGMAVLAYFAGMTSILGSLMASANSQSRLVFNSGREGLIHRWTGKVHTKNGTPMNAIYTYMAFQVGTIGIWGIFEIAGNRPMNVLALYPEIATMGTILVLLVYLTANFALPVYFKRQRPDEFKVVRHAVLPLLGAVTVIVPLYYLAKPGQPTPYNWYPYISLGVLAAAIVYAMILVRKDPGIGDRVGSLVADEY
jgi:amino acid transporter